MKSTPRIDCMNVVSAVHINFRYDSAYVETLLFLSVLILLHNIMLRLRCAIRAALSARTLLADA